MAQGGIAGAAASLMWSLPVIRKRWNASLRLMRVDLALPAAQKLTLVLEAVGDDKVRINSSSLESPLTILADQSLELVGLGKQILVRRVERSIAGLDYDSTGEVEAKVEAGYGPATK